MKYIFFLIFLFLVNIVQADIKKEVKVTVNLSPMGSFLIESEKIRGKILISKGQLSSKGISLKVKNLHSGIELRDEHIHGRLDRENYPKIKVSAVKGSSGKGKATINIKSIKEKITFEYRILNKKYIEANFQLNLKKLHFKDLEYMGVGVDNLINVKITLPYKEK